MDVLTLVVALGAGICVGLLYCVIRVESPAPPPISLVGLAGMLVAYAALTAWAPR